MVSESFRRQLRAGLIRRMRIFAAAAGCGFLLPWASHLASQTEWDQLYWLLDLVNHWQLLLAALVSASLVGLASLDRQPRWLLALPLCALPWLGSSPTLPSNPATGPLLRVVTANVHFENGRADALVKLLAAEDADLAVVVELSSDYGRQLEGLKAWPHRKMAARDDPFGLAVISRHPILASALKKSANGIPRLDVTIDWNGRVIEIAAVHPMPPLSATFARERDATLTIESKRLSESRSPALIAGDFNATPWSPAFSGPRSYGFRRATSTAPGTWPSGAHGLGIPIDHVLASPHWTVQQSRVGPDIGSDHRPVITVLSLAEDVKKPASQ